MSCVQTVPIVYLPGTYGSYLHWVLNNLTELGNKPDLERGLPFTPNGSSHRQTGASRSLSVWREIWKDQPDAFAFAPLHFETSKEADKLSQFIEILSNEVEKLIVVKFNPDLILLTCHNYHRKISIVNRFDYFEKMFEKWGSEPETNAELRECYSYIMFNHYRHATFNEKSNIFSIDLWDLVFNLPQVMPSILKFLNTSLTVDMEYIESIHKQMLSKQQFLQIDKNIEEFIKCFFDHELATLPDEADIIDEAYIQHRLRKHDVHLRCNDIGDTFPKTTSELWNYVE